MFLKFFDNAPFEVLQLIFSKLDHFGLLECQFVCKSWHKAAHRLFLEDVTLSNTQMIKIMTYLEENPSKKDISRELL